MSDNLLFGLSIFASWVLITISAYLNGKQDGRSAFMWELAKSEKSK